MRELSEKRPAEAAAPPPDTGEEAIPDEEAAPSAGARITLAPGTSLRSHAARGAIINACFQIGFALIGLLKRVAVAAFLTTTEFGLWGILVSTLITLSWLKQVGISDKYIQQEEGDQELAFQRAFTLEVAYSTIFFLLVAALLPVYALAYGDAEILVPGLVASLVLPLGALQAPIWIAYRQMRFVRQRVLEGLDPLVSAAVTVALAIAGAGYWSLVIGLVAGSATAALAAVVTSPYALRWRFERSVLREYVGFSWPLFVSGLSGIVIVQGSVLLGNHAVGLAGLGAFALANTFAVFADRVDQVIRQTIYPAVCAVADRRELLHEAFEKSNRLALMWGLPFGVGLALFAPDLITYVLGEKWRPAEDLMQAFGLIIGMRQVAFNWSVFMRALNMTRPIALNGFALLTCFAVVTAPLMFAIGLDGYAIGMAVGVVVDLAIRGIYLRRLFPTFNLLTHLVRALAPSVPAVAGVLAFRLVDLERTAGLAVAELAIYLVLTALATAIFERRLLSELVGYLRGRKAEPSPAYI